MHNIYCDGTSIYYIQKLNRLKLPREPIVKYLTEKKVSTKYIIHYGKINKIHISSVRLPIEITSRGKFKGIHKVQLYHGINVI